MATQTKKYLMETIVDLRQKLRDITYSSHDNEKIAESKVHDLQEELQRACSDIIKIGKEKKILEAKIVELGNAEKLQIKINELQQSYEAMDSENKKIKHERNNYVERKLYFEHAFSEENGKVMKLNSILNDIKERFEMGFDSLPLHFRTDVKATLDEWRNNDS